MEKFILGLLDRYLGARGTTTKLIKTDWMVTRHRDQQALGITTSLSEEEYQDLLLIRQTLRDEHL